MNQSPRLIKVLIKFSFPFKFIRNFPLLDFFMELLSPTFSILFTFLLFVFMFLKVVKRYKTNTNKPKLPPGPWELPIIGNMHHLVGSLPHHSLRDLAKIYGPLMHLLLGEVPTIVVSSPETAKEVMKTHDILFADRPHLLAADIISYASSGIVFAPYGDYWRQLRKICVVELLSSKRVQSFRFIREEEVSKLITFISSNAGLVINLSEKIFSLTYGITARVAFGKKQKDQEALIRLLKEGIEAAGGFSVSDVFPSIKFLHLVSGMKPALEKIHQKTDRILENIVNEHKVRNATTKSGKDETDDMVDVLLNLQEHGDLEVPLTTDNIKAVILDIFSAGSETSSTTVEWAMSEMLKKPSVMEKAQAEVCQVFGRKGSVDEAGLQELIFLKAVIKETLRLHPSVPLLLPRECRESCEINGHKIPVKTKVIVNAWAIGRDPMYWTEAETFYPERFLDSSVDYKGFNFELIPFGAGRRICPGIAFATPNVELPLAQLLYHFDWKLPTGTKQEDLDMTENFGATVGRKHDLCLIPTPYHPVSIN